MKPQMGTTIATIALLALAGGASFLLPNKLQPGEALALRPPGDDLPRETIEVTGTVRDFRERTVEGGHPDFELEPDRGFGHYTGNIASEIGSDRKPVFVGGGHKIGEQWRDSDHRQICPCLSDSGRGDVEGRYSASSDGAITSTASFGQWFNDAPGVNISAPLTLTLVKQDDGQYVFDDRQDPLYTREGGFFPIDDQLFGNSPGSPHHNYHFTFELHMEFEYEAGGDQFFKFIGDDDVWVFINDQLVIDLGGVHASHDQYAELDRLGLEDGEIYNIDFFFAERHRTQSNFRIETNMSLQSVALPTITTAFD